MFKEMTGHTAIGTQGLAADEEFHLLTAGKNLDAYEATEHSQSSTGINTKSQNSEETW